MGVILSWEPSTDNQSSNGGFYYNLRLGKTPQGYDLISSMVTAMPWNKKMVPSIGNAQLNISWRIDSLPVGTYYWSVQTIDQSFSGGAWAPEESFTVSQLHPFFTYDTACYGNITTFKDQTITTDTKIGCADSIAKTLTVASYPVASITANVPLTFCEGDSVTLSVISNPDYSYEWMLNNTALTNANSNNYTAKLTGKYSVEITNTKGSCKTTSSQVYVTRLDNELSQSMICSTFLSSEDNLIQIYF